jgi:hypothetical protein
MATRKDRKERKDRKTRKDRKERKSRKAQAGGAKRKGTRRLSPALRAWNERVMKLYREMKRKDPNTKLGDAMRAAKKGN